ALALHALAAVRLQALDQRGGLDARARLVACALVALGLDRRAALLELGQGGPLALELLLAAREARADLGQLGRQTLLLVHAFALLALGQLERVPELLEARAQGLEPAREARAPL